MPVTISVVGDAMLDVDLRYSTRRLSPEGVPVVHLDGAEMRCGGAAAVACMAAAFGAETTLGFTSGADQNGADLRGELAAAGVLRRCWVQHGVPTTCKRRYFLDGVQQWRQDVEDVSPISENTARAMIDHLPPADVVLVSDYGKGVVTDELLAVLRNRRRGTRIMVDPARNCDWARYAGLFALTPNFAEAAEWLGRGGRGGESGSGGRSEPLEMADEIRRSLNLAACLLKLGADGLVVAEPHGVVHLPASAVDVVDACGAGDMVLASFGVRIAAGSDVLPAAAFAVRAAAEKCRYRGAVPVSIPGGIEHPTLASG